MEEYEYNEKRTVGELKISDDFNHIPYFLNIVRGKLRHKSLMDIEKLADK